MSQLRALQESLRSRGVMGTLSWAMRGALRVNSFLVFDLPLERFNSPSPSVDGFEFVEMSLADYRALRGDRRDLPHEFYCDQTFGFTRPFVCLAEGKLAAIHWLVGPGQYSRFLSLQSGEVELNFNTVLPEYRGKRLAQYLMTALTLGAKSGGAKHLLGVVHSSNIAQYKPMLDMGFRPIEVVEHFAWSRPKATLSYIRR